MTFLNLIREMLGIFKLITIFFELFDPFDIFDVDMFFGAILMLRNTYIIVHILYFPKSQFFNLEIVLQFVAT